MIASPVHCPVSHSRPEGFTLFELVLVLGLLLVIVGLVFPLADGMLQSRQESSAISKLRTALMNARNNAIRTGQVYRLETDPAANTYRIVSEADLIEDPAAGWMPLHDGLSFGVNPNPRIDSVTGLPMPPIEFRPGATRAAPVQSVRLVRQSGETVVLEYRPLTGEVRQFSEETL